MSDADVIAAFTAAGAADAAAERGEQVAETSQTSDAPAGETQSSQTAEVQPAPAEQNTPTFDEGKFNPDELPAELQPAWKQLQAAFTQRTQELAAQRKQFEELGSVDEIQQAVELANRIADPNNWTQLYSELTQAMRQSGIPLPQAEALAREAVAEATQVAPPAELPNVDDLDPDLAPLVKMLQEQRAELDALKGEREQERLNQMAEAQHYAFVAELQKQEAAIREAHPNWDDERIEAVYEMSSFYGGNLAQAAARLDTLLQRERELYLSQKGAAMTDSTRTPAPNSTGVMTEKVTAPATLKDAEAEAAEFFAARLADLGGDL